MIHVLIVEKEYTTGEIIATRLAEETDIKVADIVTTIDEALDRVQTCQIVVANATLANEGFLVLTRTLLKTQPEVKVVATGLSKATEAILQCIEAGATGYVLKGSSLDKIVKSIRAAHNNEAFISPRIASAIMSRISELAKVRAGLGLKPRESNGLTPRERQVLDLLGRGLSNQEIADYLVIEVGTAKNYVHSILKKLEVNSRQDAVAYMLLAQDSASNSLPM